MAELVPYYFVPKLMHAERSRIGHVPLPAGVSDAYITGFIAAYQTLAKGDPGAKDVHMISMTESVYNTKATQDVLEDGDLETVNPVGINALIVNIDGATGIRRTNPIQLKGLHPMPTPTIPFAGTEPSAIYQNFLKVFSRVVFRDGAGNLDNASTDEAIINKTFKMH